MRNPTIGLVRPPGISPRSDEGIDKGHGHVGQHFRTSATIERTTSGRCGCQGRGPTDMMSELRLATPSATKAWRVAP